MYGLDSTAPRAGEIQAAQEAIAAQLLEALARHGDSQIQIGKKVSRIFGVSLNGSYLSRMLRAKIGIPLRTLLALGKFLGVAPGSLFNAAAGPDAEPEILTALIAADHQTGGFIRAYVKRHGAMATSRMLSRLIFTAESLAEEPTTEKTSG